MKKTDKLLASEKRINFGSHIRFYLKYWWVIIICGAICGALGYLASTIKSEKYEVHASLILNDRDDDGKGSIGGGLGSLISSFNMGGSSYKLVEDEILRIQNHDNLTEVVKLLHLNKNSFSKEGFFSPKVWYYNDEPIKIDLPASIEEKLKSSTKFEIKVAEGAKSIHVKVWQPMGELVVDKEFSKFPFNVKTPEATFHIDKSLTYNSAEPLNFYCTYSSPEIAAQALYEDIDAASPSKKSNIVYLTIDGPRTDKSIDILKTVIQVYNANSVATSHEEARQTVDFVEERLVNMYQQLQNNEKKIEDFKSSNKIVDPEAEAEYIFKQKGAVESSIIEAQTKAGVLNMVIDFLKSDDNRYSLIPFTSDSPEEPIKAYNELVLERMRLESNAKGNNATLKAITGQVDAMRSNLITSLERELMAAKITVSDMERVSGQTESRMSGIPRMERELISLYRDQKIQNQIYAFLLQKREENQLRLARNTPDARIMEEAYADTKPKGLSAVMWVALGVIFGICCAAVGLYLINWYQNRRDAIANSNLPVDDDDKDEFDED